MTAEKKIDKLLEEIFGLFNNKASSSSPQFYVERLKFVELKKALKNKNNFKIFTELYQFVEDEDNDEELTPQYFSSPEFNTVFAVFINNRLIGFIEGITWDGTDFHNDCLGYPMNRDDVILHLGFSKHAALGTNFINKKARIDFLKAVAAKENQRSLFKIYGIREQDGIGLLFDDEDWWIEDFVKLKKYGYVTPKDRKRWKCGYGWAGYLPILVPENYQAT
jgi:hypothetical protein